MKIANLLKAFTRLESEYETNEASIKKLKTRNAEIREILEKAQKGIIGAVGKSVPVGRQRAEVVNRGIGHELIEIVKHKWAGSDKFSVQEVSKIYFKTNAPTSAQSSAASNALSRLVKEGHAVRVGYGVYRLRLKLPTAAASKQTAKIGDDTRVTQVTH
jgi:hypothetical protein